MFGAIDRLSTELNNLKKDRKYLVYANPTKTKNKLEIMKWKCTFPGPNTPLYKGSYYEVEMLFTQHYPLRPPKVKFTKPVYHPNVYKDGLVCLDILQNAWKPTMNIVQVISALQRLLLLPNPNSPANSVSNEVYRKDIERYCENVRENIENYHKMPEFV